MKALKGIWQAVKTAFGIKARAPKTFHQKKRRKKNWTRGTGPHHQRLRGARSRRRAAKKRAKRKAMERFEGMSAVGQLLTAIFGRANAEEILSGDAQ